MKDLQKRHAKEHAEFLQLNKTNRNNKTKQLTLADALQRCKNFFVTYFQFQLLYFLLDFEFLFAPNVY